MGFFHCDLNTECPISEVGSVLRWWGRGSTTEEDEFLEPLLNLCIIMECFPLKWWIRLLVPFPAAKISWQFEHLACLVAELYK